MSQIFTDPTSAVVALVNKFALSLLIMATAFIFYNMTNKKITSMPRYITVYMAVLLLCLSISISGMATYEFYTVIPKYKSCNDCLYSEKSLNFIKKFYCTFSILFILTSIYICYLLLKYCK
jgi:sterol desaturase/sphingolipid hydroxylase (fatty acid hydroxylase superfamily)